RGDILSPEEIEIEENQDNDNSELEEIFILNEGRERDAGIQKINYLANVLMNI
ncbi:22375_t:CDS:1, partial [Gigaspora rosea]